MNVDLAPLLVPLVACNDSRINNGKAIGDPMEAALIVLAAKGGIRSDDVSRMLPVWPSCHSTRRTSLWVTFHRDGDRIRMFVKGAPALKQADIGVAMGINGTAVAKEAATIVLTDDNFATIVRAIKQGRTLYDNIVKFVWFQLSTTIVAILTVFFAPLAGLPEPFTALQILWVAIIMDGSNFCVVSNGRVTPRYYG